MYQRRKYNLPADEPADVERVAEGRGREEMHGRRAAPDPCRGRVRVTIARFRFRHLALQTG